MVNKLISDEYAKQMQNLAKILKDTDNKLQNEKLISQLIRMTVIKNEKP